jgi:transcriptional regulator with XRE-family HTH domain
MAPARGVPIQGAALRAIREARGINVSTLATDAAISTAFLSNIEAGRKVRVSPEVRKRLADRLQCSIDAIAFDTTTPQVSA